MPKPTRRRVVLGGLLTGAALGVPDAFAAFASARAETLMESPSRFRRPGLLHTADDLRFLRERIRKGEEPWKSAWERLKADKIADLGREPAPVSNVYRGPYNKPDVGSSALTRDSGAAYAHALIGVLSPDAAEGAAHRAKAIALLDAWAGMLQSIEGHDQKLLCGLVGHRFSNAAELVRHGGGKGEWPDARVAAFERMLTGVFVPPIANLFPEANGNWDAAMVYTLLCIAVFREDRAGFDRAVDFYLRGGGNGMVTNYLYPSGQCAETTRDQGHAQLGLGMLAAASRVAWNQGVDLYGAAGNRLALGFEYLARYNLREDVPCDGGIPGAQGRGKYQPIYESVYQHYAVEKALPMPYTRRVLASLRPEGYDASHPGWGTLTAVRKPDAAPAKGDLLAGALASFPPKVEDRQVRFASPSGELVVTAAVKDGAFTYALRDRKGRDLLLPSAAGVAFGDNEGGPIPPLLGGFTLWEVAGARRELPRRRPYGEHGERNAPPALPFEQRVLTLRENAAPHRILRVELRAYDSGLALRLTLPPHRDPATRAKTAFERTEFALPTGATAYAGYWHEDEFHPTPVGELKKGAWLPLTVRAGENGPYLSLAEVDDTNAGSPQTLLTPVADKPGSVVTEGRSPTTVGSEVSTPFPWRVVLVGETPAKLAESGRLVSALWPAPSHTVSDLSWVRPGKAIREVTLSTAGGVACVDFAVANGLQYILYDAGWYGPENSPDSDARRVSLDPARVKPGHPGLDLPRVLAYAKEKGVGVFLYVNQIALEKQIEELAPLYESWGVAGIKFGFVNIGPQDRTKWIRGAIALCAKHRLLVDIHDAYRPVGVSGAYPNLLTQEGVRGNEHMPTPRHNCALPFTRFLSGPGDYTVCYRNSRLQTTDAHQLALSVLYYSPLQLLYWYGKPEEYVGLPELEFFKAVPTVWDETRWLGGAVGEWAAVARRSGDSWFVAAITNEEARMVVLPLDFLPRDTNYTRRVYADTSPNAPIKPGVSRVAITRDTYRRGRGKVSLEVNLAPAGGVAVWLTPQS